LDHLLNWGRDALLLAALGLLPAALVVLLSFALRRRGATGGAERDALLDGALFASVAAIIVVAVRPGMGVTPDWEQWVLVPFRDLLRSLSGSERSVQLALGNVLGNVALYVPLGVTLALRFANLRLVRGVLLAAVLSFGMETVQAILATGRTSDVTDIAMNSLGTAVGLTGIRYWQSHIRRDQRQASGRPAP